MKKLTLYYLLFLIFILSVSCSSSSTINSADPIDGGTVGTIVYNPVPPSKLTIYPKFDEHIYDVDITALKESQTSAEHSYSQVIQEIDDKMGVFGLRTRTYEERIWETLDKFSDAVSEVITPESITETWNEATIENAYLLLDRDFDWIIEYSKHPTEPDYNVFYFKNSITNQVQAYYIAKFDETHTAVKGMLAFVDATLINEEKAGRIRLLVLTFDFSDTNKNLLQIKQERVSKNAKSIASEVFYQCSATSEQCTVEPHVIYSEPPQRNIDSPIVRIGFEKDAKEVCVASLFDSKEENKFMYDIVTGTYQESACQIMTPEWATQTVSEANLPQRLEDTTPEGGTAKELFQDGEEKSGWEAYVTPEAIDAAFQP